VKTKNKMGGCCPKGHITDLRNMRREDMSEDKKKGGVFSGRPGPRRGCSAIDGMEL